MDAQRMTAKTAAEEQVERIRREAQEFETVIKFISWDEMTNEEESLVWSFFTRRWR